MADLTPYVPRILLDWERRFGDARHQAVEGTLVFADVSGFTRLSERLARAGGKIGAEQMADVVDALFGDLLGVAGRRGGEMLKYGGDAVLLLFRGEDHHAGAAAACVEMQHRLGEIGRVETGAGVVRLRMSVGLHSGTIDLFAVGGSHRELVVAGPAASTTVAMEAAADATEVLASAATAASLDPRVLGPEKAGGRLLRRAPNAPEVEAPRRRPDPRAASFVPAGLRRHLVAGHVEPGHHLVAQAFLHLGGLDDLLATEGPDRTAVALHRTVDVIQKACEAVGVTFLSSDIAANGTKVILVAGAPEAVEEAEERMTHCVRRILDAGPPLPVRAGVHRGHVFVGEVGPPFRRTFTTIGDVTNTAARVMGRAGPGATHDPSSGVGDVADGCERAAEGRTHLADEHVPAVDPGPHREWGTRIQDAAHAVRHALLGLLDRFRGAGNEDHLGAVGGDVRRQERHPDGLAGLLDDVDRPVERNRRSVRSFCGEEVVQPAEVQERLRHEVVPGLHMAGDEVPAQPGRNEGGGPGIRSAPGRFDLRRVRGASEEAAAGLLRTEDTRIE